MTVDDVRAMALAMPDTTERPSYGTPSFRVKDKLFARVRDDDEVIVQVDLAFRDELVLGSPDIFHVTPHYQEHPWVIVRLAAIDRGRMGEMLAEAYRLVLPRPRARKRST